MTPDMEAKLAELIDRQEIWTLLLRYARGLDRMDRELIRDCYWDDAVDDHHGFVGNPDDFIQWAFRFNVEQTHVQHHGLNNHYCDVQGDDAHSETYYTFIAASIDRPNLLSIGRYMDHFQRRGGVWKIANRVTVIEKCYGLVDHPLDALSTSGDTGYGPLLPSTRDRTDMSYMKPIVPRRPKEEAGA